MVFTHCQYLGLTRQLSFCRFVAGYQDGNPKSPLICLGSGADGVSGITDVLTNDVVAYALCRVVRFN
jgi:hypothetical protein